MSEHGGQESGFDFAISPEPMTSPEMPISGGEAEMMQEPTMESSYVAELQQAEQQEMQQEEALMSRLEQEGIGGGNEPAPEPGEYGQPTQPQQAPTQVAQPTQAQASAAAAQQAQAAATAERSEVQAVQAEQEANNYAEQTYTQENDAFDQTLRE